MKKTLTGLLIAVCAGTASGQVLECYDAKGTKTIAQFCPPGTVRENQLMKGGAGPGPSAAPSSVPAQKSLADRDAEFKKRALERQEADKKSAKAAQDAKDSERNCFDARSQLRALQDGQRISRTDPKTGERIVLDDKDRPGEIATAQKNVDNWCNRK